MPILNEAAHLEAAVSMVLAQDWQGPLQVVLAVGPSSDGTRDLADAIAAREPAVTVVDNPTGRTPDALNAAIAASSGDVVVRVDGHAEIPTNYISLAVATLTETGADNVGGTMHAQGRTRFERAVASAMRSPLGVGAAKFHVGGQAGPVDTVYLGVFRRAALDRVQGYDPRFSRSQDWEMNLRLRRTGGTVWFNPDLQVTYRPRGSFRTLAKQYFHYGRWRRVVMRENAGTASLRYLAAPAMVAGTCAAGIVGIWWPPALVVPVGYLVSVAAGGFLVSAGEPWGVRALTGPAIATMHWSWGVGFLTSPTNLIDTHSHLPGAR